MEDLREEKARGNLLDRSYGVRLLIIFLLKFNVIFAVNFRAHFSWFCSILYFSQQIIVL